MTTTTAVTRPVETFRCAGCAAHTAVKRYELCPPCVGSRPDEDDTAAGDVGYETGNFA